MKRILPILLSFMMCVQMNAQSESCLAVVNELNNKKDVWTSQESIDYILAHKDAFDMDDEDSVDRWFYNFTLGKCYYSLQQYQEALTFLQEVTRIYDSYGEWFGFSSNTNLLQAYYWEANCELNTGAAKDIVLTKLRRAKVAYEKYSLTESDIYNQILADINVLDSEDFEKLKIIPQAMEYVMSEKHKDAIILLEQIIGGLSSMRPIEDLATYCRLLSNSYIAVGRLDDAERLFLDMLSKLSQSGKEKHESYRTLCDALGVLYTKVHNYQKAKDFSGRSKWLHEQYMDFDDSYIWCLSNCALAESGLGNKFMAKMLMDIALHYLENRYETNDPKEFVNSMQVLSSLGGAYLDTLAFSAIVEKTMRIRPYIQLLSNASLIYQEAGFWDEAVVCIKKCISMSEEIGEENIFAYNNLATLYLSQSRIEESLLYLKKAYSLCRTDFEKNDVWFNYALVLWLSHAKESSEIAMLSSEQLTKSIGNSFAFLSNEERFNYYKHFEYYFPMLNLFLYETGDKRTFGQIYNNVLITKGLLLRTTNMIKQAIMESGDVDLIQNYNRMSILHQQLLTETNSITRQSIAKEFELLDKQLTRSAASYAEFSKLNNIKWNDIRDRLSVEDVAIEFYNIPVIHHNDTVQKTGAEPRYCAIILKKDYSHPKVIPLSRESELELLDFEQLYSSDILYNLIWKPLEQELKGVMNIYFAADGELHNIGIEYAQLPNGGIMNDSYNMFRLSTTRVLAEDRKDVKALNAVLYGGLKYDLEVDQLIAESRSGGYHSESTSRGADLLNMRYGVKYLPGTKEEVEDIYKSFALNTKARCRMITDMAGTEESFKSLAFEDVGIIHLATHGFYWNEEEAKKRDYVSFLQAHHNNSQHVEDRALQRSGLFFTGANLGLAGKEIPNDVEDGVLTAQELSVMNLVNVDMVVMSACQSGLGETSGEGVFGLQRGFKLAGANTLLMSLWKVDDEATKILMTEFYRNYLSGKSKRESLLLAQRMLRKTHPEPEYWAGFILLDALN